MIPSPPTTAAALAFALIGLGDSPAAAQAPPAAVTLSDTVAFAPEFGQRAVASYAHAEGETLVVQVSQSLANTSPARPNLVRLRHVTADGSVTDGPYLERVTDVTARRGADKRLARGATPLFVGGADHTVWLNAEPVPGDAGLERVRATVYDAEGAQAADRTVVDWRSDLVELRGVRARTSRYGGLTAVAVLTTRRSDRRAPQAEAGAQLTLATLRPDGSVARRLTSELPDKRATYHLSAVLVDGDTGDAAALLRVVRYRLSAPTVERPLVREDVVARLAGEGPQRDFAEEPLVPPSLRARSIRVLDQEPLPPAFVATYAVDFVDPVDGLYFVPVSGEPRQLALDREALVDLPEQTLQPPYGFNLSGRYALTDLRAGADGALYAAFAGVLARGSSLPTATRPAQRSRDGFFEGVAMLRFAGASPDGAQRASYLRVRQRRPDVSGRPPAVGLPGSLPTGAGLPPVWPRPRLRHLAPEPPVYGAMLVPDGRGGCGLLYNEETANLRPQLKPRARFTAWSFAVPTLATVGEDGRFDVAPLPVRSPYPDFAPLVAVREALTVPGGCLVAFAPLEVGFRGTRQWGWFGE